MQHTGQQFKARKWPRKEHNDGSRREVELTWHPGGPLLEQLWGPSGTPNAPPVRWAHQVRPTAG